MPQDKSNNFIQSDREWEDLFDTITDMITIHDRDFNIVKANRAAQKILDLPFLQKAGAKCFKYYHGADTPPEGCPSCNCLETGEPASFEVYEPHLKKYIEIRAMPRFDSDNNIAGLIHVVRDITERKRIEDAIAKAKFEWETTVDNVGEFILIVDRDLNIIRCNRSFANYANRPINELLGRKCLDFFPCERKWFEFNNHIKTQKPLEMEEIKTKNGHWFYVSHRPVYDQSGIYIHSVIIATDITELKETQQKMLSSEKELKKRVNDLEKFYKMAVGREIKMRELKEEIAELRAELAAYKQKTDTAVNRNG
jgi:PAS domain S-box-containing protein